MLKTISILLLSYLCFAYFGVVQLYAFSNLRFQGAIMGGDFQINSKNANQNGAIFYGDYELEGILNAKDCTFHKDVTLTKHNGDSTMLHSTIHGDLYLYGKLALKDNSIVLGDVYLVGDSAHIIVEHGSVLTKGSRRIANNKR